ncbi:MAG: DUF4886 domain-containing protein [Bacteroidales bacterium]
MIFLILVPTILFSQSQSKKVLFIGNSYTYVNDLPQMISDMANSTGDNLSFDSNCLGGYTLQAHHSNLTTLQKISLGDWDYVVLQEQSQLPSFPDSQIETQVYPYAQFLDSVINSNTPCAETIFFMTWGRKNGDASNCGVWPPVCTYEGMDSLLNLRYRIMAEANNAILSPVGQVWKYLRQNHPEIELYQSDESHPSLAGTYAAACTFYTVIFRKNPELISFNSTLNSETAVKIKAAAKHIVYENMLEWHVGEYDPKADFDYYIDNLTINFTNNSLNAISYIWEFGNGDFSTEINPQYSYSEPGNYNVILYAIKCELKDSISKNVNIIVNSNDYHISKEKEIQFCINSDKIVFIENYNFKNVKIFDLSGKCIIDLNDFSGDFINLKDLMSGIYILQIFNDEMSLNKKIFISK